MRSHLIFAQGFDDVRRIAAEAAEGCSTVVLTALIGGLDGLRQPRTPPTKEMAGCYFAFVDRAAAAASLRRKPTSSPVTPATLPTVGVWRLLTLGGNLPFGENARRNSRVPKMLPHRFFPHAEFCVWVDAKLQLQMAPEVMVDRFLRTPGAGFAALRNLRKQTIGHEYAWISSWMCPSATRHIAASAACAEVQAQWQVYAQERRGEAAWQSRTVVIEGALLLMDLRATATLCLLCSWFNEYALFSERDQLSFAYVLHAQRAQPRVSLLPRRLHWSVTVEDDTAACYNATDADAAQLAVRFQHGMMRAGQPALMRAARRGRRGQPPAVK